MSIEKIVRPFADKTFTNPVATPVAETENNEVVRLEIGRFGNGLKMLNGSYSNTVTRYMDREEEEMERKTTPKRVENPNDPSQFVDVERVDELRKKGGRGRWFQRISTKFKPLDV